MMAETRCLTYVSLGAGLQSSALLVMSALELRGCPRADFAVFADTQDEPQWVYQHLAVMTAWASRHGLDVVRVTAGRLGDETLHPKGTVKRRAALPVFTTGVDGRAAMLPRQCTEEYKLAPIRKYLRQRLGYQPRQRIPAGSVTALVGISYDELTRLADSRHRWITNRWPLAEAVMRRHDCEALLTAHGLPIPNKSACIYCPFHDDVFWQALKAQEPQSFEQACAFDEAVRNSSSRGLRHPVYLHRSLIPLRDVTFREPQDGLNFGFESECSGSCGT